MRPYARIVSGPTSNTLRPGLGMEASSSVMRRILAAARPRARQVDAIVPVLEQDAESGLFRTAAAEQVDGAVEVDLDALGDSLGSLVPVPGPAECAQPPVDDSRELGFVDDVCLGGGHGDLL
jgi:hypothetical protein